jgi:YegS/Rv2252/BmrU family lipid kinase
MTRAFVVVNPVAGGHRTRRLWHSLRDQLVRLGLDFEFAETAGRGAAVDLARRAVQDRWPLVVAVGGDGTVNEVINGLTDDAGRSLGALGAIVTGRGRDVCRNLRVASDPVVAARRLLQGEDVLVDLGVVESAGRRRYFVNAAGAGFDAEVAERAQVGGGSGTLPYLLGIAGALRAHRPVPTAVHVDDQPAWTGAMTAAVVANGAYYGGGMMIAPGADPADGYLDVVVLGDLRRVELLCWLPTVYRGAHLRNPKVVMRRARTIMIDPTTPVRVHVDGEGIGHTPIRLSTCPKALRLRR